MGELEETTISSCHIYLLEIRINYYLTNIWIDLMWIINCRAFMRLTSVRVRGRMILQRYWAHFHRGLNEMDASKMDRERLSSKTTKLNWSEREKNSAVALGALRMEKCKSKHHEQQQTALQWRTKTKIKRNVCLLFVDLWLKFSC